MEIKCVCCDFCNPCGDLSGKNGKNCIHYCDNKRAVEEFDWKIIKGKIMCIECQEVKGILNPLE